MTEIIKEPKFENSSWNFKLDQANLYAFWNNAFSKEECQTITNIAKDKGLIKGTTKGESDVRDSKISWLYPTDNMDWVYRRVTDITLNLNERFFKFDLFGINEGFQFTNYEAPSGKYGKHVDRSMNMRELGENKKYTEVSFMIFRTGSCLIVGNCSEKILMYIFDFIKNILQSEYQTIHTVNEDVVIKNKKIKLRKKKINISQDYYNNNVLTNPLMGDSK
jgi:hypothetical protein